MRHIAKNCPTRREKYKKRNNKRHHAHAVEYDEPPMKMIREKIEDYVLFSTFSGFVLPREETWLIDNGASKHMTCQRDILSSLTEKKFTRKLHLEMITSTLSKEWENPPTKLIQGQRTYFLS
jgi:hypothetical protein